jgi:pyruvate formate lyase activating enzyme
MIGGIHPCSFIDFPGNLAAVLFVQGCNLKCGYCHNPQLIPRSGAREISWDTIVEFLKTRRGKLTGVVVSGGEPTLCDTVPDILSAARSMGFLVKLDTNGTQAGVVRRWASEKLFDYAAVDVKIAPGAGSHLLCGMENQADAAAETLRYLVESGVPCEARTTVVDGFHDAEGLEILARMLHAAGVRSWRLQPVERVRVLDADAGFEPPDADILARAVAAAASWGIDASVRGAGLRSADPGR